MEVGLELAGPPLLWSAHPMLDLAFPVRVLGMTLQRVFLGTSLPVHAFENENPPGEGAILTEVLRIYQMLAGREETFSSLDLKGETREGKEERGEGKCCKRHKGDAQDTKTISPGPGMHLVSPPGCLSPGLQSVKRSQACR